MKSDKRQLYLVIEKKTKLKLLGAYSFSPSLTGVPP